MIAHLAGVVLLLLALLLGLRLPDLDQQLQFLVHRFILTHGFLLPLGLFLLVYRDKTASPRFLSMGFSLAAVTHLCFDLFPRAWIGFALIHIPFWRRKQPAFLLALAGGQHYYLSLFSVCAAKNIVGYRHGGGEFGPGLRLLCGQPACLLAGVAHLAAGRGANFTLTRQQPGDFA